MYLTHRFVSLISVAAMLMLLPTTVSANEILTCESSGYKYTHCNTRSAGYITLKRQLSGTACIQGRTWDYDRRGIWVDDGCKGEFLVDTYKNRNSSSSKDAKTAAGLLLGAVVLGALINNEQQEDDYKYKDKNYYGSRHSSYVPDWMVGRFEGYNRNYNAEVEMRITDDGRVVASTNGQQLKGWINDERLHIGDAVFDIDRSRKGFITSQKGDRNNEVRYYRVY